MEISRNSTKVATDSQSDDNELWWVVAESQPSRRLLSSGRLPPARLDMAEEELHARVAGCNTRGVLDMLCSVVVLG